MNDKFLDNMIRIGFYSILCWIILILTSSCTYLHVERPDGTKVTSIGGFLVNRKGEVCVTNEYLDPQNNLHQQTIRQAGEENTDNQYKLLDKALDKIK
jgi:hypothetical protein